MNFQHKMEKREPALDKYFSEKANYFQIAKAKKKPLEIRTQILNG